jgi:four helix bundle protein
MENRIKGKLIRSHLELDVYKIAFDAAMKIFELTKQFPTEEKYSLTDQIRRASRSVCGSFAEAWRRRRYEAAFVNKINEAEGEAAETQTWIQFSVKCGYVQKVTGKELYETYDQIIGKLVRMLTQPDAWRLKAPY